MTAFVISVILFIYSGFNFSYKVWLTLFSLADYEKSEFKKLKKIVCVNLQNILSWALYLS